MQPLTTRVLIVLPINLNFSIRSLDRSMLVYMFAPRIIMQIYVIHMLNDRLVYQLSLSSHPQRTKLILAVKDLNNSMV